MTSRTDPFILALDVGYGNVKGFGASAGNPRLEQSFHFPSLAVLDPSRKDLSTAYGQRLQLCRVVVDDREYLVGEDAGLVIHRPMRSALARDYSKSAIYRALVLAALHRSKLTEIDVLALGLPAEYSQDAGLVEGLKLTFIGTHQCAERKVTVRDVAVYSQPVGGMASFAFEPGTMEFMKQNDCLLIDPGYNTLDWTMVKGSKVIRTPSDSVSGGMEHYYRDLKQLLLAKYPELQFNTYLPLGAAIRGEAPLMRYGKPLDIREEVEAALPAWFQSIEGMIGTVGSLAAFGGIFVVGGAADVFTRALRLYDAEIQVRCPEAPAMLANARGFYVMARKQWLSSAERDGNMPPRVQRFVGNPAAVSTGSASVGHAAQTQAGARGPTRTNHQPRREVSHVG